jgi:hypothetical protein
MPGMTGTEVPSRVRLAALLCFTLAPIGLLLVLVGVLELHWFGTSDASRLTALIDRTRAEYGIVPPALLRGREGAIELILMGLAALAFSALGVWLRRGRLWARTTMIVAGVVLAFWGLFEIGADATEPNTLASYYEALRGSVVTERIPQVQALLYPGWYSWVEDVAQGLEVIALVATLLALAAAIISNSDYFTGGRSVDAPPDAWDDALSRVREQSKRQREADAGS